MKNVLIGTVFQVEVAAHKQLIQKIDLLTFFAEKAGCSKWFENSEAFFYGKKINFLS
jgi:hypothetical protein